MAAKRKQQVEQNALRVVQWLANNQAEFEQQGIFEDKVAAALGLADLEAKEAVDHLENREDVVRMPKALTTPPQFLLKPGRGWPAVRDKALGQRSGG
jgi:hypothetical protein